MEQLINMVKEKAGISTEQAQKAVQTVTGFIKDKLPANMQGQLDSIINGKGSDMTGGLKDKMGGFFG